ncbi:MAG: ribosomal protein S18-alanine N-acetyltransferase [Pseudomonadota bacterium]
MSRLTPPRILDLGADHVDALVAVAEASTAHPWSRTQFRDELQREPSRITGLLVAMPDGAEELAAYLVWWLVLDEVEILDVATHPQHRRQGLARMLVQDVLERACGQGARLAHLEVRASNQAARALYAALGFVESGRRRGYYSAESEDALLMSCTLSPA